LKNRQGLTEPMLGKTNQLFNRDGLGKLIWSGINANTNENLWTQ
jgi:hypothetical protein